MESGQPYQLICNSCDWYIPYSVSLQVELLGQLVTRDHRSLDDLCFHQKFHRWQRCRDPYCHHDLGCSHEYWCFLCNAAGSMSLSDMRKHIAAEHDWSEICDGLCSNESKTCGNLVPERSRSKRRSFQTLVAGITRLASRSRSRIRTHRHESSVSRGRESAATLVKKRSRSGMRTSEYPAAAYPAGPPSPHIPRQSVRRSWSNQDANSRLDRSLSGRRNSHSTPPQERSRLSKIPLEPPAADARPSSHRGRSPTRRQFFESPNADTARVVLSGSSKKANSTGRASHSRNSNVVERQHRDPSGKHSDGSDFGTERDPHSRRGSTHSTLRQGRNTSQVSLSSYLQPIAEGNRDLGHDRIQGTWSAVEHAGRQESQSRDASSVDMPWKCDSSYERLSKTKRNDHSQEPHIWSMSYDRAIEERDSVYDGSSQRSTVGARDSGYGSRSERLSDCLDYDLNSGRLDFTNQRRGIMIERKRSWSSSRGKRVSFEVDRGGKDIRFDQTAMVPSIPSRGSMTESTPVLARESERHRRPPSGYTSDDAKSEIFQPKPTRPIMTEEPSVIQYNERDGSESDSFWHNAPRDVVAQDSRSSLTSIGVPPSARVLEDLKRLASLPNIEPRTLSYLLDEITRQSVS